MPFFRHFCHFGGPLAPPWPLLAILDAFWAPFRLPFGSLLPHFGIIFPNLVFASFLNGFLVDSLTLRACQPTHLHAAQFLRSAAYSQRNFLAAQFLLFLANRGGPQGWDPWDPKEGPPWGPWAPLLRTEGPLRGPWAQGGPFRPPWGRAPSAPLGPWGPLG